MFRRVLLAVLCLVPSVAFAGDFDPETFEPMTGVYWRYLIEWNEEIHDTPIAYHFEGFRDSGVFAKGKLQYKPLNEGGTLPPPMQISASGLRFAEKLDTDGDWDVDVDDLNIVRNEFGELSIHDISGDGVMGVEDLNKIRNEFGLDIFTIEPAPWRPMNADQEGFMWIAGDIDESCVILLDARLNSNPVIPCAESLNTPEPSSFLLAGIGIMALSRRIWSRCRRS